MLQSALKSINGPRFRKDVACNTASNLPKNNIKSFEIVVRAMRASEAWASNGGRR
jgi:hypothetical protein